MIEDIEIDFSRSAAEVFQRISEVEKKYGEKDPHLVEFVREVLRAAAKYATRGE